jgi:hypothetical protein
MILDAQGRAITVKKQIKENRNKFDPFNLPDGVVVSAKDFLLHVKKIRENTEYREKLERAEREVASRNPGFKIPALEFNRMSYENQMKFLSHLQQGEAIALKCAIVDEKNESLALYSKIDRKQTI